MQTMDYSISDVDPYEIYAGSLSVLQSSDSSKRLADHALKCIISAFGEFPVLSVDDKDSVMRFAEAAAVAKNKFTNDPYTHELLEIHIHNRYFAFSNHRLLYDVPRLRIVPNTRFLSSGVSYNYLPHRDTWYGSNQGQINHWISVKNVTQHSTFYIAPNLFQVFLKNTSETFDLDKWDNQYRKSALDNIEEEKRPHPKYLGEIREEDCLKFVLPAASEIVFSAQHLHGSAPNTTYETRISIDFRVLFLDQSKHWPLNLDNRASGDYTKYLKVCRYFNATH